MNIDMMCCPSGASEPSKTLGTQMSANGSADGRPATASWKAFFAWLSVLAGALALLLVYGCAGPKFVRACDDLAMHCSAAINICEIEHWQRERDKVKIETCYKDNDRLFKMLAEPESKKP